MSWTLDPRTDCCSFLVSHALPHCLKDWDFNDPYIFVADECREINLFLNNYRNEDTPF